MVVVHIPHASRLILPEDREALLVDDATLARELLCMTDAWTDRLVEGFRLPAIRVIFPVSRLFVDVERFPKDAEEPMTAKGMGAVYTRLSTGGLLRAPDPVQRARLVSEWYHPHHEALTDAIDAVLAAEGHCLIIDVHSFSSVPLPHEPDQDPERPEICIGTDPFHSAFETDEEALRACQAWGFSAALNRPFSGSIVPTKHWGRTNEVRSVMIEARRDLYMSEESGKVLADFDTTAARVCDLLEALCALATFSKKS